MASHTNRVLPHPVAPLAQDGETWQAHRMPQRTRSPAAGGFPIAAGALLGTAGGVVARQPTIGFLIGIGAGIAIAIAIWLVDRRPR